MPVTHERGYLIPAIDSDSVDYLKCAVQLARSIRRWHPDAKIATLTVKRCPDPVFDHVIPLPHGDLGGYRNDWQVFQVSPFRETIKLEADMLVTSEIDHWWTLFRNRDVVISTGCRDFYDGEASSRFYRKVFDHNDLPDVYNAITYWRLSSTAKEFWDLVRQVFMDWDQFRSLIRFAPEQPDTDLVYAMAAEIMGRDRVTLPFASYPKITHMKQHIIGSQQPDWTEELIWEWSDAGLRVNTVSQWGCFHYHQKHWNHVR